MSKFSDPVDEAAHIEEQFTQRSIEAVLRAGRQEQISYTGRCRNCEEPLEPPHRFCDEHCTHDWERAEKAKKRNGLGR